MNTWFQWIYKPMLFCCGMVLFTTMYPGNLIGWANTLVMTVAGTFLSHPLLGLAILLGTGLLVFLEIRHIRCNCRNLSLKRKLLPTFQRIVFINSVIGFGTLYLVMLRVPLRLGFLLSCSFLNQYLHNNISSANATDKQQQLANWRRSQQAGRLSLNQQLGIYGVQHVGIDADGGTYFVIDTEEIISTATLYGIAHQPQPQTPFGRENYRARRILGDWYEFRVIDERSGR